MTRSKRVVLVAGPHDEEARDPAVGACVLREMKKVVRRGDVVIQGGAKGVDAFASTWADQLDAYKVTIPYYGPAGRAGGPARNRVMVEIVAGLAKDGYEAIMLAFHHGGKGGGSAGTNDCIRQAVRTGVIDVRRLVLE